MLGDHQITLKERIVMGIASGAAGAVLGMVTWFLALWMTEGSHLSVVGVSATYFFAVGYLRGSTAGDIAEEAMTLLFFLTSNRSDVSSREKPSAPLWIGYVVAVVLGIVFLE
ncbi:MAG: hypothetical protein ABW051_07935 [Burkholderiaceae bacterium]